MMTIGVTGAAGFIGGYVLPKLAQRGDVRLRALYRRPPAGQLPENVDAVTGDLASPDVCAAFCDGLDAVIHLAHTGAPMSSGGDLAGNLHANLLPTLNLIEAARAQPRPLRIIFASSGGAIYGFPHGMADRPCERFTEDDPCHPIAFYGVQKLAAEQYLRIAAENGWIAAIVLRMTNPYGVPLPLGRRQGIIGIAMQQALSGEELPIYGSLDNVRDYIHLDDVAAAFTAALRYDAPYEVFNIASGMGYSLREVLAMVEKVSGKTLRLRLADGDNTRNQLVPWVVANPSRAWQTLGWRATIELEVGIDRLYAGMAAACRETVAAA